MREKTPYETGGFAFSDEKMMEKAVKEAEGIEFVKSRTDMQNPEKVLAIYREMVERQMFETPVGYAYLYELQEYLKTSTSIEPEYIPAIPVVKKSEEKEKKPEKTRTKEKTKEKEPRQVIVQYINFKNRFRTSFSINIILLLIVIGMFAVAATSGNVNILNYENKLIEKYEMWESDLKEREDRINLRESELQSGAEKADTTEQ